VLGGGEDGEAEEGDSEEKLLGGGAGGSFAFGHEIGISCTEFRKDSVAESATRGCAEDENYGEHDRDQTKQDEDADRAMPF
jgi:hypothetical protein